MGKRIIKIEPGEENQFIRLHLAPGNTKLPELAYLPQGQPLKPPEILLGTSLDGPVTWDPDKVPHLLIGGSTGSGKTTLGKTIISQCLPMGDVYIIDLKGGLDYPPQWQTQSCSFATTSFDALSVTGQIVQQLNQRKEMFDAVVRYDGIPCFQNGNIMRPWNLCRHRLHKLPVRISGRKLCHIFQVTDGVTLGIGKSELDIFCEAFNKSVSPDLMGIDYLSDGMIEQNHLLINTNSRFVLCRLYLGLDLLNRFKILTCVD